MGYDGYGIDGVLYGFKTELLEMLRNGDVPNWLFISRRTKRSLERQNGGRVTEESYLAEKLEDKWVRKNNGLVTFQLGTKRTEDTKEAAASRTPQLIAEKCRDWLDANRDGIEYRNEDRFVEFRRFELDIAVGERGGIKDVFVSAVFKNH
jgi:hypothetical protein